MGLSKIFTLLLLAVPSLAAPAPTSHVARADGYWVESIQRQGVVAFGNSAFKVFRNVKEYGAVGDGVTDDTAAINAAIADGSRCTQGCDSSTTVPAIVYFPAGTYLVTKPLVQLYYTQFIGNALNVPVLKAAASFQGMAVIDSDPYDNYGNNFWVNQNNFFRQVRNFVIDLTAMPAGQGAGIHWQVAQATSLQNIRFEMSKDPSTKQLGIFMDNGSGGFMSDLIFNGGQYCAFFGNQQFTTRNLTFNDCQTAIFMNWNWVWALKDIKINNCKVGIDMSNGGASQTVGSVLISDTVLQNTPIGILTAYDPASPQTNGTLILDNVDTTVGVGIAVQSKTTGATLLPGNQKIGSFVQGRSYGGAAAAAGKAVQTAQNAVTKPAVLLDTATGSVFTRSKPQYENLPLSSFVSVKTSGAKGDGVTDDTAAVQAVFDKLTADQVAYFDHGAYLITDTIKVPKNAKITGEIWPMIMAGGNNFKDQNNPRPVFQIGQAGDVGNVELSDLIFETAGPAPGAIMIEWNVAGAAAGDAGMWDVHARIGGSAGTQMELAQCAKNPNATHGVNDACLGAYLLLHVTPQASAYLENTWFWVADHSLEPDAHSEQIDIYSARGVLIETQNPVWLYGTASEHSVLYNYQLKNASNIYMSAIQTETPYFQGNPTASAAKFVLNTNLGDPDFATACANGAAGCDKAWGLRVVDSTDVFVYGAGLYSFFDNYDQTCLTTESCQANMVSFENSKVQLFGLSTKASTNMLTVNGASVALDSDNRNNFCATLAVFQSA